MATSEAPGDDGGDLLAAGYSRAKDYARDRLEESDVPLSAAEIAEEYGCTSDHSRNCLRELMNEGEVRRVARGMYEPIGEDEEPEDLEVAEVPESLDASSQTPAEDEIDEEAPTGVGDPEVEADSSVGESDQDPPTDAEPEAEAVEDEGEDLEETRPDAGLDAGAGVDTGPAISGSKILMLVSGLVAVALLYWLLTRDSGGGGSGGGDGMEPEEDPELEQAGDVADAGAEEEQQTGIAGLIEF